MISSNGYAAVAESLSRDPDKETYVFRRFDKLTARNLLNLQGELMALQAELDDLDAKAALSPDPVLEEVLSLAKELPVAQRALLTTIRWLGVSVFALLYAEHRI